MVALTTYLRKTSSGLLKSCFDDLEISLPGEIDWSSPDPALNKAVRAAVQKLDRNATATLVPTIDRLAAMSDEAGELALQGIVTDRVGLAANIGPHDRALWTYLNYPEEFRRAEETRFTDERRRTRTWEGFLTQKGLEVRLDAEAQEAFRTALGAVFTEGVVLVDIFERVRPTFEGVDCKLIQITIYREGWPSSALEFVEGDLVRQPRRPVSEASMTYEPETGVVEIVANNRDARDAILSQFAKNLLATEFLGGRLPRREFSLQVLKSPCKFQTDASDGIESVTLRMLRLMPTDAQGERLVLETTGKGARSIWSMSGDRFGQNDPLRGGWIVTMAKLVVQFHPVGDARRGKSMPLTITMPHGCDLKDQTAREQMIGAKYLRRWGLLVEDRDVDVIEHN